MMRNPIITIISGFVLWSLFFLLLYAVQATGCHFAGRPPVAHEGYSILRVILIIAFLLSLLAVAIPFLLLRRRYMASRSENETVDFTREVAGYVWIAAAVATPFCFAGVMWLSLCGT